MTAEEELAEIEAAISKVLTTGKEVTYNGNRLVRADVEKLYMRKDQLISEINRKNNSGGKIRMRFGVPL